MKPITCRLCGFEGSGRQVLTLKTHWGLTIAPVECPDCLSLDIVDEPIPYAEAPEQVNIYVEVGAGIDTIASLISSIDTPTVSSFVDIGCGYGFSLKLAEGLYGWRAYGYEPSPLAKAGAGTLGVDIRHEPFTRESRFTHAPDYVFSSEVIEHIPDPLEFLSTIRAQLPEDAVLVMTTPNRACVDPSVPEPELIGALSPGFHVLVASAQGMRLLAERAGFANCVVREEAERLVIAMAHKPSALARFALREVSRLALDDWYERTIQQTEPGTPLRIGLTRRLLDSLVAQGKFSLARPVAEALIADMTLRFDGFDIDAPLANEKPSIRSTLFPLMVSISYNLGMISLLGDDDPLTAAKHFSSSLAAGEAWFAAGGAQFLALVNMVEQARITRLVALARCSPEEAERESLNQDATGPAPGYLAARTLVEAVAHGHESSIGELLSAARTSAPNLVLSDQPAERIAGQDALFMMANVCERNAELADAAELYGACLRSCLAESTQMSHEIDLIRESHLGLKRCGVPEAPAPRILDLVTHASPLPPVFFAPEVFWRDAAGVFLEGWVHAGALDVTRIDVRHGDVSVPAETRRRDDLTRVFVDLSPDTRPNFRAYVPRGRGDAIDIVVTTQRGTLSVSWQMPFHNLPARESASRPQENFEAILAREMALLPDGPVLVIGARTDKRGAERERARLFGERQVVCVDIHAGPDVDIVGDVHHLAPLFEEGTFQAVVSMSVLEHLEKPRLAAAQMLRVLTPGGLSAHAAPWVWPTHAAPNDFFRMSPEGLASIFSSDMGCDTVATGSHRPVSVTPAEEWRTEQSIDMPALTSDATSWIISRKVAEPAVAISWPFDHVDAQQRAQQYPEEGIQREWGDDS